MQCIVCAHIHTHAHTYTPTPRENRQDTDNTPINPFVKHRLPEPPHIRPPTLMNRPRNHRCMCTPCSELECKCVRWCQNTCATCTPAYALVLKTPVLVHATFRWHRKKCTCTSACAPIQQRSKFYARMMETIANFPRIFKLCFDRRQKKTIELNHIMTF